MRQRSSSASLDRGEVAASWGSCPTSRSSFSTCSRLMQLHGLLGWFGWPGQDMGQSQHECTCGRASDASASMHGLWCSSGGTQVVAKAKAPIEVLGSLVRRSNPVSSSRSSPASFARLELCMQMDHALPQTCIPWS